MVLIKLLQEVRLIDGEIFENLSPPNSGVRPKKEREVYKVDNFLFNDTIRKILRGFSPHS